MRVLAVLCALLALAYSTSAIWYANIKIGDRVELAEIRELPYVHPVVAGSELVEVIVDPFSELAVKRVLSVNSVGDAVDAIVDEVSSMKYVRVVPGENTTALLVVLGRGISLDPIQAISVRSFSLNVSKPDTVVDLGDGVLWSDVVLTSLYDSRLKRGDYLLLDERKINASTGSEAVLLYVRKYRVFSRNFTVTLPAKLTVISYVNTSGQYYLALNFTGVKVLTVGEAASVKVPLFSPHQRVYRELYNYRVVEERPNVTGMCKLSIERGNEGYRIIVQGFEPYVLHAGALPFYLNTLGIEPKIVRYFDAEGNKIDGVQLVRLEEDALRCSSLGEYKVRVKYDRWHLDAVVRVYEGEVRVVVPVIKPKVIAARSDVEVLLNGSRNIGYVPVNSTIRVSLVYNNTIIFEYFVRVHGESLVVNMSKFVRRIEVLDAVGTPLESFRVHTRGLSFEGSRGVASVILAPGEVFRVETCGVVVLSDSQKVIVPVLPERKILAIVLISTAVALALALPMKREKRGELVEEVL